MVTQQLQEPRAVIRLQGGQQARQLLLELHGRRLSRGHGLNRAAGRHVARPQTGGQTCEGAQEACIERKRVPPV